MSWISKCLDTYNNNLSEVGEISSSGALLCPMYFGVQKVQVEVVISENGDFLSAKSIDEDTVIPYGESSHSRSSVSDAHPLNDNLKYIAFGTVFKEHHDDYMKKLESWANSNYSHIIVKAVYSYVKKGNVFEDLVSSGVLKDNGSKNATEYEKIMLRFCVVDNGGEIHNSWTDKTFFEIYKDYYENTVSMTQDVCMVTGQMSNLTLSHPNAIIKMPNRAKLVSANDEKGFSYKGRFSTDKEAMTLSAEASLKAHNALRWLVAKQSVYLGGRYLVTWNSSGLSVPKVNDDFLGVDDEENGTELTMPEYKDIIQKIMSGYKKNFLKIEDKSIQIIMLDAATTGRLSITYYNEIDADRYIDELCDWNNELAWQYGKIVKAPSVKDIIKFSLGTVRKDKNEKLIMNVDDKVMKAQAQVLIECMFSGRPLPKSYLHAIIKNINKPFSYWSDKYLSNKLYAIACSLIKKYKYDTKKEEITMELDENNKNRSYLFGRLLAIAERVEKATYEKDENRMPTAIRLQPTFSQYPMRTWSNIEKSLTPYFKKLANKGGLYDWYKKQIAEIFEKLNETDVKELNKPLTEDYVLGYYLQRSSYYKSKNENLNKNEIEVEEN